MRGRWLAPSAALLAGVLLAATTAVANPFGTLGAGHRSSAMLVGTALSEGPGSLFYNPASLPGGSDTQIVAGFQMTELRLEINGLDIDEEEIGSSHLGLVHPTNLFGAETAIGVLISIPFQRVSRLLTLPLDQPQFLYYGTRNQRLVVMAGAGVRVNEWLSVGVGVQTLLDAFSEPDFSLVQDPDSGNDLTDPETDALEAQSFGFASAVQDPVLAPIAGIRLSPLSGLDIGVAYRGQIQGSISAPFLVTIEEIELLGLNLAQSRFVLPNDAQIFFNPHELSIGVSYRTRDGTWSVGLDVTWFDWSDFPPTFSEATPVFSGGLSELILPVPEFLPIKPPTRDVVVPALGAEWWAVQGEDLDVRFRGGYSLRPTMLDEDRSLSNYLDSTAHIVAAGLGLEIRDWSRFVPKPLSLSGYVQMHVLENRDVTKEDPASSPFGDLELSGYLIGGGVEATIRF